MLRRTLEGAPPLLVALEAECRPAAGDVLRRQREASLDLSFIRRRKWSP